MRLIVHPHKIDIIKEEPVNEKEIDISKCYFEFDDEITDDYVKEAYFTLDNNTYKQIILNNECSFPSEVLEHKGDVEIGVVAYKVENDEEIKRYNPSPAYFNTWLGSLKEAENSEPITPTDKEQIEQMLSNIRLSINKEGKIATISFTNTDGITQTETLEDGKSIEFNWQGTSLGIRQEGESVYQYVDLKGDKGEPGAIKMIIVNELPETGSEDTIYLVPNDDPETGNNYDEYIYVNGAWEKLGGIQVEVDLTDYVKFTDYATASKGGVIKTSDTYANTLDNGSLRAMSKDYAQYNSLHGNAFVSKNTLENVITGKALETANNKVTTISNDSTDTQYPSAKCVYGLVGNIESILTTLDIGSGV